MRFFQGIRANRSYLLDLLRKHVLLSIADLVDFLLRVHLGILEFLSPNTGISYDSILLLLDGFVDDFECFLLSILQSSDTIIRAVHHFQ